MSNMTNVKCAKQHNFPAFFTLMRDAIDESEQMFSFAILAARALDHKYIFEPVAIRRIQNHFLGIAHN